MDSPGKVTEKVLLIVGMSLLLFYGAVRLYQHVSSREAIASFDRAVSDRGAKRKVAVLTGEDSSDLALWSEGRIKGYRDTLKSDFGNPVAILSISRLQLRVPVFEGTSEPVLNRGVGLIDGTAKPDEGGNVGIAGHRDGFFRSLKDIGQGDLLELTTLERHTTYKVDEIEIVDPTDVAVLRPRKEPSVTLVTCYPFYYNGSAPKRYIVHASIQLDVPNQVPSDTSNH